MLFPESWLFQLFLILLACISGLSIARLTPKQTIYLISGVFLLVICFSSDAYQDYPHYFGLYQSFISGNLVQFDSEPGFLFLNQLFALTFGLQSYRLFLCFQFLIGLSFVFVLVQRAFRQFRFFYSFAVLFFGCSAILIFIASPRSGLSFCFALSSLIILMSDIFGETVLIKVFLSIFFAILAVLLHSQYLLQLLIALSAYLAFHLIPRLRFSIRLRLKFLAAYIFAISCMILAFFAWKYLAFDLHFWFLAKSGGGDMNSILSGDNASSSRLSAIFSILYPAFFLFKPAWKAIGATVQPIFPDQLRIVMGSLAVSGAMLNIVFYSSPHYAGRLTRLSEFSFFPMIPIFVASLLPSRWQSLCIFVSSISLLVAYPVFYSTYFR